MKEVWKDIKNFEGLYQVSNLGKVKSLKRIVKRYDGYTQSYSEKLLKTTNKNKYEIVVLCKNGIKFPKSVHRIVAETFIPNIENKPNVDHIDTNIHNNCANNLRWVTQKENCLNEITRKKNSISKLGHKGYLKFHTEISKKKMSDKKRGIKFTEEHKRKLSIAHKKKKGENYEIIKSAI